MPDHEESQKRPSSPNRIAASRANGALSHGPSTPEGKLKCAEASAKANIKHGMLADTVVLNGESRDRFIALLESFIAEHGPITQSEQACVHKMAVAYWRQMRTWSFQSLDFNREMARQDASFPAPAPRSPSAFSAAMTATPSAIPIDTKPCMIASSTARCGNSTPSKPNAIPHSGSPPLQPA